MMKWKLGLRGECWQRKMALAGSGRLPKGFYDVEEGHWLSWVKSFF
jgi:hypothetical protein